MGIESRTVLLNKRKKKFFDRIARLPLDTNPGEIFNALADVWNDAVGAAWTLFWLRAEFGESSQWERVGVAPSAYSDSPQPVAFEAGNSPVTEFVFKTQKPEFIFDQDGWSKRIEGTRFSVLGKNAYAGLHSESFVAIPLPVTAENNASNNRLQITVNGSLCCHVKDRSELERIRDEFSNEDLETMALLMASRVRDAFERRHLSLLVKLNQLASTALTEITKNPRQERHRYLLTVAELIKAATNSRAVSFFYRMPLTDPLAFTRLDSRIVMEAKIPQNSILNCRYGVGECRTGSVFKHSAPIFLPGSDQSNSKSKFIEAFEDGTPSVGSAILEPIPQSAPQKTNRKDRYADGVIRCIGRKPRFNEGGAEEFDSLEAQTLKFIANQVGPVLDTLAARIRREDQVNIVRHDLLVPARMVSDTVDDLVSALSPSKPVTDLSEHLLPDLAMASRLLLNLILQLDAEPQTLSYSPRKTFLEGQIVARNRAMLQHFAKITSDITVKFETFRGVIPPLWIDPDLVERAVFNVIVNAIKYGEPGSCIEVVPRVLNSTYVIDVQNWGVGISEDDQEKIFDRYYRSPSAKRRAEGIGLGLYISRAAMEKNGAKLFVSRCIQPTVFTFSFPKSLAIRR